MRVRRGASEFGTKEEKERHVERMFDAIAPTYDRVNRVVSLNFDRRWRRLAARAARGSGRGPYLDVGAGTGDLSFALAREAPGARVVGVDIARHMLARGPRKPGFDPAAMGFVQGSGLAIPARDATFEAITNAFVLRNLADLDAFFSEARRTLRPGGKLVSLEIGQPRGRVFGPLYRFYFYRVMPRAGRVLSGNGGAYAYLADSVARVEPPAALEARMRRAGLVNVRSRPLLRGAVVLFEATRAAVDRGRPISGAGGG